MPEIPPGDPNHIPPPTRAAGTGVAPPPPPSDFEGPQPPPPEVALASASTSSPMDFLREFLRLESAGGLLLIGAAALALLLANSPMAWLYDSFLDVPVVVQVGALELAKPLLLWVNDSLMAVFFLLVGCEVKREVLEGQLSQPAQVVLPGVSALGGMLVPALIYVWFNLGDPVALDGWAIPAATDIAFALGILALLGPRVPASLKLFLLVVAIIDDLGAIVVIALFYTADLSLLSLLLASASLVGLVTLNLRGVVKTSPYLVLGAVLWVCVLKSGVHATLAGVALGLALPLRTPNGKHSPLRELEHSLHPWVAFLILPLFAFANAGVALDGITLEDATGPVPAGIALGLLLGKPLGILLPALLLVALGLAEKPKGASWPQMVGVSLLCGVGFTMSLFIGSLAFEHNGADLMVANRIGILSGSLLAATLGYLLLRLVSSPPREAAS